MSQCFPKYSTKKSSEFGYVNYYLFNLQNKPILLCIQLINNENNKITLFYLLTSGYYKNPCKCISRYWSFSLFYGNKIKFREDDGWGILCQFIFRDYAIWSSYIMFLSTMCAFIVPTGQVAWWDYDFQVEEASVIKKMRIRFSCLG